MSECIVRMDMPVGCIWRDDKGQVKRCPMYYEDEMRCQGKDGKIDPWADGKRPDWCPILGVLPDEHGRLVDADLNRDYWLNLLDSGKDFCVGAIVHTIDRQDAIIPAAEDLKDITCIMMSKKKSHILHELIEDVLDTLIEVGNGVTDEMLHYAAEQLFDARDLLNGKEFEMRTHDYD